MRLWYPRWYPKNSGCLARAQRMGGELRASGGGKGATSVGTRRPGDALPGLRSRAGAHAGLPTGTTLNRHLRRETP